MAVRIAFYAADIAPLERFLNKSLGKALQFVSENGREEVVVSFHTDAGRHVVSPRYGVLYDDLEGGGEGYV